MQNITIKQELNLDDYYEMECNENYSITAEDLNNFTADSSAFQESNKMVEIKHEPSDDEETLDAPEIFYQRNEILEAEEIKVKCVDFVKQG